ncbi:MAG: EAL domain-containing protein [Thiobacillaceae bacterium]|nr:EAL domain-containing protein [Thiobacillaceae bacterium]MCX7672642.1 EAL domain-containing protein [Thiobacillaceae bacterium]MDW8323657.1 EAL domain-containing protein [Burkholderiales bacterium]
MRKLKLHQLYGLILLLVLALWAALGLYAHLSLRHLAQRSEAEASRQALVEIGAAVAELERRLETITQQLAAWDETRQHLNNPEYYPLWRDVRVRHTGLLPEGMRVALYRPDGTILARDAQVLMPARLSLQDPRRVMLRWEQGKAWLYRVFPIPVHPDARVILGYGLIKLDPLAELRTLGPYRYADPASFGFRHHADTTLVLSALTNHLRLSARPDPSLQSILQEVHRLTQYAVILALALAVLFLVTLRQLVVRPMHRLSAEIGALRDDPQREAPDGEAIRFHLWELEQLRRTFLDYHHRLYSLHREVQRSSELFYRQARQDALTGVYNRRAFDEDRMAIERDKRVSECTLILFDCDHFKAINDTYGHPVGDLVIQALAQCLTSVLRADDRLYRLGGDEFASLMPGASIETALRVAERCQEQVRRHDFSRYGITEPVTLSIGLAHGAAPLDLTQLHRHADLAMYRAKQPGHSKIAVYEEALGRLAALVDNREISAVYEAIRRPELLQFRYQPVVRLPGLVPAYCEALCRIRCEDRLIGPGAIFAIVQNRRLDVEFDLAVIEAIRRDLAADLAELRQGVSINVSGPGLVSDQVIAALLHLKAQFPQRKLVVEITETALITQMDKATANIARLRAAGCLVALDDFGSGYSSLRYLASMPVDMVKFDMSLIHLLVKEDPRERLIVQDIAQIIATAGYELVAEGIETPALLEQVIAIGFSHAQGYHLDRIALKPPTLKPHSAA